MPEDNFDQALGLAVHARMPSEQHGEETTQDDPAQPEAEQPLTPDEQQRLIQVVRDFKQKWFLRRRMIVRRVLKAFEFFKGNQFISFDPESFQWFDALDQMFSQQGSEYEDLELYQFATNFYQMFGFAFVAALSSQLPKTQFMPENAEREEDIATAKAASRVQQIVERQNNVKSLHKQGLLFLWMAGCYFRHTRYIVDASRAGTHREPVVRMKVSTIMPDRFLCPQCGQTNAAEGADDQGLNCQGCNQPLGGNDFYPAETAPTPVIEGDEEVPNGMVAWTLYSPMHVDAAPYAKNLRETPILNVDEEIDVASLRESYPEKWDQLKTTLGPISPDNQNERMARQYIYSEAGSRSNFIQDMQPTLSRTWIQPWALNALEDRQVAEKLKARFPKGALLVNVGDLFLEARDARLEDEWSWAGTVQETFGLYPPAVGDAAIPVQERINDAANITHEYMDRLAAGLVLYNSSLIDGEGLNGKPMLPGILNPVQMKQAPTAAGNKLEDAIVQIKSEMDTNIYSYQDKLVFTAQMLVGTPPQIYGGAGDPNIQTKGGQSQQLQTAMGKLSLFWDNVREEASTCAELSVKCAARNMTDKWTSVVTDESHTYRNEYVRLEEMRGNVHAYPESDPGFPMSYADIRAFWEKLIEYGNGGKNPYVNAIMDDPTNQEQIATWTGVPGLVVPGKEMRDKTLRIVDMLMNSQPINSPDMNSQPGPDGGPQMLEEPSIKPDRDLDDMDVIVKTVRHWAQKNFDRAQENPQGYRNVVLYYKAAFQFGKQQAQEQMQAQMAAQQAGQGGPPAQGENQ